MLRYNGYLIVTEPDYKEAASKGEIVDDLWCQVYDENDTELKQMLGDFNIVRMANFNKSSAEAIETAIMEVVEEDMNSFELARKINELDRMKALFTNAAEYIAESVGEIEAAKVLKESIGMTDEEMGDIFGRPQEDIEEGMKMM